MDWKISHRADPVAAKIADRHYNRQKIGSPQFVPPGRCLVLLSVDEKALWVSSYPFAEYTKHDWAGAWVCSCFRNESKILSSSLIAQAVAATRFFWGDPPDLGMITFVDSTKVKKKRDFGRCYLKAGFRRPKCPSCCGVSSEKCDRCKNSGLAFTKGGLLAFQLLPDDMPKAQPANNQQLSLAIW